MPLYSEQSRWTKMVLLNILKDAMMAFMLLIIQAMSRLHEFLYLLSIAPRSPPITWSWFQGILCTKDRSLASAEDPASPKQWHSQITWLWCCWFNSSTLPASYFAINCLAAKKKKKHQSCWLLSLFVTHIKPMFVIRKRAYSQLSLLHWTSSKLTIKLHPFPKSLPNNR